MIRPPRNIPVEGYLLDWLDYADQFVEFRFDFAHCRVVLGEVFVIPNRIINTDTSIPGHRSPELYAAILGGFEGRVNDHLSDYVNVEHVVAGLLRKLLVLIVPGLLIC